MGKQLLSIDTNPKTVKGQKFGFLTGVLYLAPSDLSGYQVCPMAETAKCADACLNSAGRGAFNSVQSARIAKTKRFHETRFAFLVDLAWSIKALVRKADRMGLVPLVRLNGTSDIRWENIPFGEHANMMAAFPDVQFYDYTKIANRRGIPENYDLTFSYSGAADYAKFVEKALDAGMRVAAVWRKRENIPAVYQFAGKAYEVIPGDDSDLRHLEPKGKFVALYAKGKARKDTTGFVLDSKPASEAKKRLFAQVKAAIN